MSPSQGDKSLVSRGCPPDTSCGISSRFQLLSPSSGQVAHVLLTRPPLSQILFRRISRESASFDLHVLGTPPAFVLSQDQTLNKFYPKAFRLRNHLLIAITSSQRNFQAKPFGLAQNPFWCLFSISFSYFVQFTRYTSRPIGREKTSLPARRFANIPSCFRVCQAFF